MIQLPFPVADLFKVVPAKAGNQKKELDSPRVEYRAGSVSTE
jgi:hypothetical protein